LRNSTLRIQQKRARTALIYLTTTEIIVEVTMQNWKKAIVFGSLGAGAVLILTGRRPVGMACAAAGLAVLASEYPERFEAVWENAPDYLQKGMQIFSTLQKVGENFAEQAERRSVDTWRTIRSEYGS
jgi:hypothetical protein